MLVAVGIGSSRLLPGSGVYLVRGLTAANFISSLWDWSWSLVKGTALSEQIKYSHYFDFQNVLQENQFMGEFDSVPNFIDISVRNCCRGGTDENGKEKILCLE